MPAAVHSAATSAVHNWALVTEPPAMTSFTLALVMVCGVSSTEGTWRLPVASSEDAVAMEVALAVSPLASAIARSAAAAASFYTSL